MSNGLQVIHASKAKALKKRKNSSMWYRVKRKKQVGSKKGGAAVDL